jgi:hypothetical protein
MEIKGRRKERKKGGREREKEKRKASQLLLRKQSRDSYL